MPGEKASQKKTRPRADAVAAMEARSSIESQLPSWVFSPASVSSGLSAIITALPLTAAAAATAAHQPIDNSIQNHELSVYQSATMHRPKTLTATPKAKPAQPRSRVGNL